MTNTAFPLPILSFSLPHTGKAPKGVCLVDFSQSTDDGIPIAQKAVKEKSGRIRMLDDGIPPWCNESQCKP
jgi:hypothetical protein